MTPRDRDATSGRPELLVVVASTADAQALAPLAHSVPSPHDVHQALGPDGASRPDPDVVTSLVATGPDPMAVDLALDDAGTPAARVLFVEPSAPGPAHELAVLLPRIDQVVAEAAPAGVVVRGGSVAALAAARVAVWRGVPIVHLPVHDASLVESANQAAVAELTSWQTSPAGRLSYPAELDLLVHRRLAGDGSVLVPLPWSAAATGPGLSA